MTISYKDFEAVDIGAGKIIKVDDFPEARKPAYKLTIDFGPEIGIKKSSAQITHLYTKDDLVDRLIMAVINFDPKQIGPFMSECLTLGFPDAEGNIVLAQPEKVIPLGSRMF